MIRAILNSAIAACSLFISASIAVAQTACEDPKIVFIVDDSGSIDVTDSDRSQINASLAAIQAQVTANFPGATFGAVQYGSPGDQSSADYSLVHGYQATVGAVSNLPLLGMDHLPGSIHKMITDGLFTGSGALANPDATFIFTDAQRKAGTNSSLENTPVNHGAAPGFAEYANLAALNSTGNVSVFHAVHGAQNASPETAQGNGAYIHTPGIFQVTDEQAIELAEGLCPSDPPEVKVEKTCDAPTLVGGVFEADCVITVEYTSDPAPIGLMVEEYLFVDGTQDNTLILSASGVSDPWDCSIQPIPASSPLDQVACTWDSSHAPPPPSGTYTSEIAVTVALASHWETAKNCVTAELSAEGLSETLLTELVCADIPPPPEEVGAQCTPFDAVVSCDPSGRYVVELTNAQAGHFDPTKIDVTVHAPSTVTTTELDSLKFLLNGASAGETIKMSLAATQENGGSEDGLDLCCLGDLEVTIPEGLVCEPETTAILSVEKHCVPSGLEEGGNTRCDIFVNYSGPEPDSANPITIIDNATPPIDIQSVGWLASSSPLIQHDWQCDPTVQTTPFTCELTSADVVQTPPVDWSNFSSMIELYFDAPDAWRNCADVSGPESSVGQGCYQQGDFELNVSKKLSDENGSSCVAGEVCHFDVIVDNLGTTDYTGNLDLTDIPEPGGEIVAINTLPGCDPVDLTVAGCRGAIHVPAGGQTVIQLEYIAPFGAEPGTYQNCIQARDESMSYSDPAQKQCVDFELKPPLLSVSKTALGTCLPNQECEFELEIANDGTSPFTGNVMLYEQMGGITGRILDITPMPAGCAIDDPFICITEVSINPSETLNWTVTATMDALDGDPGEDQNCFYVVSVPSELPTGSLSEEDTHLVDVTEDDLIGHECVSLVASDPVDLSIAKEELTKDVKIGEQLFRLTPRLESGTLVAGDIVTIQDDFASFGIIPSLPPVSGASVWDCQAPSGVLSCTQTIGASGVLDETPIEIASNTPAHWEQNCATISATSGALVELDETQNNNESCAFATEPAEPILGSTNLQLVKTAAGECDASRSSQSYTCEFDFEISNLGTKPHTGPLAIQDSTFAGPDPKSVKVTEGEGWACTTSGCFNKSLFIEPNDTASFRLRFTLPALRKGGEYCNEARLGLPDDRYSRVFAVQEAMRNFGIDGGPSDGKSGPKTRRGVRALQEMLGLDVTGQVDDALLKALGLLPSEDAKPSRACVGLDPIAPRPLACERSSTRQISDYECACRFTGMLKTSKTACACPRGTKLHEGECLKINCPANQVLSSSGQCYCPAGTEWTGETCAKPRPKCDRLTTIESAGKCLCREGFQRLSDTICIPIIRRGDGAAGTEGGLTGGTNCAFKGGVLTCTSR